MSTSQLGEFPQVLQNMLSSGSQIFQDLSGGIPRLVGRNKEKYFTAEHILLEQRYVWTCLLEGLCNVLLTVTRFNYWTKKYFTSLGPLPWPRKFQPAALFTNYVIFFWQN